MPSTWDKIEKQYREAELAQQHEKNASKLLRLVRQLTSAEKAYTNAYRELQEFMANTESESHGNS